ncbi:MAG: ATP-binding protein, partial [Peptostreptococcaceae bacterium]
DIQKIRFEGDFDVAYDIDNSITTKIPSLIIQPLVENALEHGVLKSGQEGDIYILVEQEDDRIHIAIENTGIPIEQNVIDDLDKDTINSRIGLKNVHTRLKMIYGKGLTIHKLDNGTKIEFYVGGENESYNN